MVQCTLCMELPRGLAAGKTQTPVLFGCPSGLVMLPLCAVQHTTHLPGMMRVSLFACVTSVASKHTPCLISSHHWWVRAVRSISDDGGRMCTPWVTGDRQCSELALVWPLVLSLVLQASSCCPQAPTHCHAQGSWFPPAPFGLVLCRGPSPSAFFPSPLILIRHSRNTIHVLWHFLIKMAFRQTK